MVVVDNVGIIASSGSSMNDESYHIAIDGFDVRANRDEKGRLQLSTTVFSDSYIPQSVRSTIRDDLDLVRSRLFTTSLAVNEERQQVVLTAAPRADDLDASELLQEFLLIALEWEHRLHERGERDLVYVRS